MQFVCPPYFFIKNWRKFIINLFRVEWFWRFDQVDVFGTFEYLFCRGCIIFLLFLIHFFNGYRIELLVLRSPNWNGRKMKNENDWIICGMLFRGGMVWSEVDNPILWVDAKIGAKINIYLSYSFIWNTVAFCANYINFKRSNSSLRYIVSHFSWSYLNPKYMWDTL